MPLFDHLVVLLIAHFFQDYVLLVIHWSKFPHIYHLLTNLHHYQQSLLNFRLHIYHNRHNFPNHSLLLWQISKSKRLIKSLKGTYRIEQNHSFIHNFQMSRHEFKIMTKLINEMINFIIFYFNNETIWKLHVLCWYDEVISLRY